jgi:amidase
VSPLSGDNIRSLGAEGLSRKVGSGALKATAVAEAYLDHIAAREPEVLAWKHLDPEQVLAAAEAIDAQPKKGSLAGVPIGVKDVIDTSDMPTGYGTEAYDGFRPLWDAPCIALSRDAGGLVLGKTVSTEFAMASPGKTRNPHNPAHTPGGSSSGSCAAVGAGMAVMAFGTQTAGSIIRPAAYCGTVGYKPTFGLLDPAEVKVLAHGLDTLGMITRTVRDAAWCTSVLAGRPKLVVAADPAKPVVGLFMPSRLDMAGEEAIVAVEVAADKLSEAGVTVRKIALPAWFDELHDIHAAIMGWEVTHALAHERLKLWDRLTPVTRAFLTEKAMITVEQYDAACARIVELREAFAGMIDGSDVLMTLPAPGAAPEGLGSTGAPAFNTPWTTLHTPCLTVPVIRTQNNLPVGIQLVGRIGDDARLFDAAAYIETVLGPAGEHRG